MDGMMKLQEKTMRRVLYILLGMFGMLSLIIVFFAGGVYVLNAQAKNDKCPDGHECKIAIQNQTGEEACRPVEANLGNGWTWTDRKCGQAKEKKSTETPRPIVITYTPKPPTKTPFQPTDKPRDPTSTPEPPKIGPTSTSQSIDTTNWVVTWTPTPTQFVAVVSNLDECPEVDNCICLLVTEAYIGNHLDRERNFLMATQNAILLDGLRLQQTVNAP